MDGGAWWAAVYGVPESDTTEAVAAVAAGFVEGAMLGVFCMMPLTLPDNSVLILIFMNEECDAWRSFVT